MTARSITHWRTHTLNKSPNDLNKVDWKCYHECFVAISGANNQIIAYLQQNLFKTFLKWLLSTVFNEHKSSNGDFIHWLIVSFSVSQCVFTLSPINSLWCVSKLCLIQHNLTINIRLHKSMWKTRAGWFIAKTDQKRWKESMMKSTDQITGELLF